MKKTIDTNKPYPFVYWIGRFSKEKRLRKMIKELKKIPCRIRFKENEKVTTPHQDFDDFQSLTDDTVVLVSRVPIKHTGDLVRILEPLWTDGSSIRFQTNGRVTSPLKDVFEEDEEEDLECVS